MDDTQVLMMETSRQASTHPGMGHGSGISYEGPQLWGLRQEQPPYLGLSLRGMSAFFFFNPISAFIGNDLWRREYMSEKISFQCIKQN